MLNFFIAALKKAYRLDPYKIRAELHLRADQEIAVMKERWAKELSLPIKCFTYAYKDQRTRNSKTYDDYMGVCMLRVGGAAIQRRLMFLSAFFGEEVINNQ